MPKENETNADISANEIHLLRLKESVLEKGDSVAAYELAQHYFDQKDAQSFIFYLTQASDLGHLKARIQLVTTGVTGLNFGEQPRPDEPSI